MSSSSAAGHADFIHDEPCDSYLSQAQSPLLALPTELLYTILTQLDPIKPDFWRAYRTCKSLRQALIRAHQLSSRFHSYLRLPLDNDIASKLTDPLWIDGIRVLTLTLNTSGTIIDCSLPQSISRLSQLQVLIFSWKFSFPSIAALAEVSHGIECHWPCAKFTTTKPILQPFDEGFNASPLSLSLMLIATQDVKLRSQCNDLVNAKFYHVEQWTTGKLRIVLNAPHTQYGFKALIYTGYSRNMEVEVILRSDIDQHTVSDTLLKRLGMAVPDNIKSGIKLQLCIAEKFYYLNCCVVTERTPRYDICKPWSKPQGYLLLAWRTSQLDTTTTQRPRCIQCNFT